MKHALIAFLAILAGCVSSGTHEALQKEHAATLAALKEEQAVLEQEKQKSQQLSGRIARQEADIASANRARESLEAEKSAMISDKSKLQASIDEMKRALADLAKRKAEGDARLAEFKSLINRFRSLIDAGKLKVKIADGRMVVELASDVLFASGSATLSRDGQGSIKEVAGVLATIPERKFQVEGHTDNVPIRSQQYPSNWELAAARSITVAKTMVDAGMPPERISAASFGENKPARANDSSDGRAANRRIEIVVVPDLSSLPGFEELNRVAAQSPLESRDSRRRVGGPLPGPPTLGPRFSVGSARQQPPRRRRETRADVEEGRLRGGSTHRHRPQGPALQGEGFLRDVACARRALKGPGYAYKAG